MTETTLEKTYFLEFSQTLKQANKGDESLIANSGSIKGVISLAIRWY
jgi:hypothetical protein